jgi:hypothetical protein
MRRAGAAAPASEAAPIRRPMGRRCRASSTAATTRAAPETEKRREAAAPAEANANAVASTPAYATELTRKEGRACAWRVVCSRSAATCGMHAPGGVSAGEAQNEAWHGAQRVSTATRLAPHDGVRSGRVCCSAADVDTHRRSREAVLALTGDEDHAGQRHSGQQRGVRAPSAADVASRDESARPPLPAHIARAALSHLTPS